MLVLSRKLNEEIVIDGNIRIRILEVRGGRVRVGIEAPAEKSIRRAELPPRDCGDLTQRPRLSESLAAGALSTESAAAALSTESAAAALSTESAAGSGSRGLHTRVSRLAGTATPLSAVQRTSMPRAHLGSASPRGVGLDYSEAPATVGQEGLDTGGLVQETALPVYRLADLACAS